MIDTPQNQVKDQQWQHIFERVALTVDALGKRIDMGIMGVVLGLNANNINTTASCEGHLDRALPYPWIDIEHKDARVVVQKVLHLIRDGKREDGETKKLQQEVRKLHLQEEQKLISLLDAFYRTCQMDYDKHLVIWRFAKGEPRLQSHGAEYQEFRSDDEKAIKLKEYQEEMQNFALFLRDRFFED